MTTSVFLSLPADRPVMQAQGRASDLARDAGSAAWQREMERAMTQAWFDHRPLSSRQVPLPVDRMHGSAARAGDAAGETGPVTGSMGGRVHLPAFHIDAGDDAHRALICGAVRAGSRADRARPVAETRAQEAAHGGANDATRDRVEQAVPASANARTALPDTTMPTATSAALAADLQQDGMHPEGEPSGPAGQAPMIVTGLQARRSLPELRPTLRLHVEWHDEGVRLWLGSDPRAGIATKALAQQVQRWLGAQGLRLLSLVCNGRSLYAVPAEPAPVRRVADGNLIAIHHNPSTAISDIPFNKDK